MNLLISACLLGLRCRYDGQAKPNPRLEEGNRRFTLLPVCPEVLGGLQTPRIPAERVGTRVMTEAGGDVTEAYWMGAEEALRVARKTGCTLALLKEKSPSCGSGAIYDGTFSRQLIPGDGVCAEMLKQNGIRVFGESEIDALLKLADATEDETKDPFIKNEGGYRDEF